ncbi:Echinocandin B biosynthetic cluster transcription factor ecdB [Colletotrichum siamense]|uniref:Echinocandin B biosynthetic cluster transcription factor ecdB n=1 Tax=Colletotrichum siamense TaxID=690259 RepID=UPI001872D943|nr:Echinocandin B biosynthetic cluster transcription factor ecdB [Colletotrichum siamense]KAF5516042.1 Echinocandin B biosynthetic cluster transcription factor ecdB [Colletotrichum siamense]
MLKFEAGLSFFNLACSIFRDVEDVSWESVQCLLLIALYNSSKLRVYDHWRFINKACSTVIILLPLEEQLRAHHCQLYWIAYLQESQILVEFEFPSSGLSGLESSVPLPLLPDPGIDPRQKEYQFFFLALVSMRRLLNRIHSHLYNQERLVIPTPSVLYELNRQIEEWKQCLPSAFQFSDLTLSDEVRIASQTDKRSMQERLKGHLKARYHAAKTILYRPHVHRVIHSSGVDAADYELDCAKTAIASALIGILHGGIMHEPFQLLLFPINSWRTLFAIRIQIQMIQRTEVSGLAAALLPDGWEVIDRVQAIIVDAASPFSPTITRDYEIVQSLAEG